MGGSARQLLRRLGKGAVAAALHHTGARDAVAGWQRRTAGGTRVLVLAWHRVVADFSVEARRGLPALNVSQATFVRQLDVLQRSFDVVTLDAALEVLAGRARPRRDVAVLTFDDGYRDVHTWALPVLRARRLPAVVYVPSGYVGTARRLLHDRLYAGLQALSARGLTALAAGVGGRPELALAQAVAGAPTAPEQLEWLLAREPGAVLDELAGRLEERLGLSPDAAPEGQLPMTWEMLRELVACGWEVGAHTVEHTVLVHERLADARREIAQCRATLEAKLERKVRHFAWCNGWYSEGLVQALRAEGFVSAVTTEDLPNHLGADPFALKRKTLWEVSSAGPMGSFSPALTACQLDDVFTSLALQRPVLGVRATRFDGAEPATPPAGSGRAAG